MYEGQQIDLDSNNLVLGFHNGKLCPGAFYAAYPYYIALKFGGSVFYRDSEHVFVPCPDPKNQVVMELKRVRAEKEVSEDCAIKPEW